MNSTHWEHPDTLHTHIVRLTTSSLKRSQLAVLLLVWILCLWCTLPAQSQHINPKSGLPAPQIASKAENIELPLQLWRGLPIVFVELDGRGPYPFLIDPGASQTIVDLSIAEVILKDPIPGPLYQVMIYGQTRDAQRYSIHQLKIGQQHWRMPGIPATPLTTLSRHLGSRVYGIIGADLLREYALHIDIHQAKLRFLTLPLQSKQTWTTYPLRKTQEGTLLLELESKDALNTTRGILNFSYIDAITIHHPAQSKFNTWAKLDQHENWQDILLQLPLAEAKDKTQLVPPPKAIVSKGPHATARHLHVQGLKVRELHYGWRAFAESDLILDLSKNQLHVLPLPEQVPAPAEDVKDPLQRNLLHQAVSLGLIHLYEPYIKAGINLNGRDINGLTPLHLAVILQDLPSIQSLLKSGADAELEDESGRTAFWYAASGHPTIMQALIDAKAKTDTPDRNGITPLMNAARSGLTPFNFVSQLDQQLWRTDSQGRTALIHAMAGGHLDLAMLLISQWDHKSYQAGQVHPLLAASEAGMFPIVQWLDQQRIPLTYTAQRTGTNALHLSASHGHSRLVRFLIAKGVSMDARMVGQPRTPLLLALLNSQDAAAYALLSARKQSTTPPLDGYNSLHLASARGMNRSVGELIAIGFRLNQPAKDGNHPLHLASRNGHKQTVELLAGAGAWLDAEDALGFTPLMLAISQGHYDIAHLLLDANVNTSARDNQGNTLLHLAMHHPTDMKLLESLLAKGLSPHTISSTGWTPLSLAARFNRKKAIAVFLKQPVIESKKPRPDTPDQARPFIQAIIGFHHDLYPLLVSLEDKDSPDGLGDLTPMTLAASLGNTPAIRFLATQGYALNSLDRAGRSPLAQAIIHRRYQAVRLLINLGADQSTSDVLKARKECQDPDILSLFP